MLATRSVAAHRRYDTRSPARPERQKVAVVDRWVQHATWAEIEADLPQGKGV